MSEDVKREPVGITETADMVEFIASLGNAIGKSLDDKKLGLSDIANLIGPVTKLPAAVSGISKIAQELADMDDDEKDKLIALFREKFDVPQDGAEEAIEDSLRLIADIYEFANTHFRK
jgi:hypothetical protein